jgi:hypothetical protein
MADPLVLEHGPLRVTVGLDPLTIEIRRGRRLIRELRLWAAGGESRDQFVQLTEGVLSAEELERPVLFGPAERNASSLRGALGEVRVGLADERVAIEFEPAAGAFRIGAEWEARSGERFSGLGARHGEQVEQTGRHVRLGADRRYTGPDCPPDMLDVGGIPQGDYAPVPWLMASRGYALWLETEGDGAEFDLGHRVGVSARAAAGPFRLHVVCDPTPAGRLRRFLRLTGLPPVLPEWGYGHWKSRDVYEHERDVVDDFDGYRRHGLPLDALVLDSPWETQYNTWEPNPHQFPDFEGMVTRFREAGVRTVVWVTPWVNIESRDGQQPPDPESERLHAEPASNYEPAAEAGHFVRAADGTPHVARWWMGTGSPVDFTSPAAEEWWREQAKRVLRLGVEGIKADDGEGWYYPPEVSFADGRTGAQAAWALGLLYRRSMQRALDEVHPGSGVLFGRPAGPASRPSASPGAATSRPTSGRSRRSWRPRSRRPRAASRTGRTTWAAISASDWSRAARRSCCCAGCSSAASPRLCRRTAASRRRPGPTTTRRCVSTASTSCCTSGSFPTYVPRRPRRHAAACRSCVRCSSRSPRTNAAGHSLTSTATARRSGWPRCSNAARASARCRSHAATGSTTGRVSARPVAGRSSRRRRSAGSRCTCAQGRSS